MRRRHTQPQQMTPGGEYGLRTPVEHQRSERASIRNDAVKPTLQALLVSVALVQVVLSFLTLCVVAGPVAFWISASVVGIAAFIWTLQFASTWWEDGVYLTDIIAMPLMMAVVGAVAYCISIVAGWVAPAVHIQPWAALSWFILALSFWVHLELTMLQRLALPSLFQDQAVWGALGNLLEWIVKRRVQHQPPERPIMNRSDRKITRDELPPVPPPEQQPMSEIEGFLRVALARETLTRDGMTGAMMETGNALTKNVWRRCVDILVEQGYVANSGSGNDWTPGNSAQTALDALV